MLGQGYVDHWDSSPLALATLCWCFWIKRDILRVLKVKCVSINFSAVWECFFFFSFCDFSKYCQRETGLHWGSALKSWWNTWWMWFGIFSHTVDKQDSLCERRHLDDHTCCLTTRKYISPSHLSNSVLKRAWSLSHLHSGQVARPSQG